MRHLVLVVYIGIAGLPMLARAHEETAHRGVPDNSIASSLPPALADPGDVRRALAGRGIQFAVGYISDILSNPFGGIAQSTHYAGLVEASVDIDFETLAGWRGLTFHADAFQIHGTSISVENLGSIVSVSNIEAWPSTRLFELWFDQSLFEDTLSLRFGQLAADAEFLIAESAQVFIASTFGWTTLSSDNLPVGGPIYGNYILDSLRD